MGDIYQQLDRAQMIPGLQKPGLLGMDRVSGLPTELSSNETGRIEHSVENELYKNIVYQLKVKKIYLEPKLSLVKFSLIVGTNTTYLSGIVNRHFGMNLKTLINKYRVNHARRLLLENKDSLSLNDIIRMSGFSSRSVFYATFQREMGMTPSRLLRKSKSETPYINK